MRKVGEGINPSVVEDPIQRKYWEIVRGALSEISAGTSNIINNINYPSLGDPNFNALNYLDLRGRVNGQVLTSIADGFPAFTIKNSSGQTADIQTWVTSAGVQRVGISPLGQVKLTPSTNSLASGSLLITVPLASYNSAFQPLTAIHINTTTDTSHTGDDFPAISIDSRNKFGTVWIMYNGNMYLLQDTTCGGSAEYSSQRTGLGIAWSEGINQQFRIRSNGTGSGDFRTALLDVSGLASLTPRTFTFPDASGTFALLPSSQVWTGLNTFQRGSDATELVVKGFSGQTVHLQEWQNSTGTVLSSIGADGSFIGGLTPSGATEFTDNLLTIADGANNTRKFKFQAGSITAGNTRTYTVPDYTGWFPAPVDEGAAGQVLTSGGAGVQPTWATPASGTTFADNVFDVHNSADATKKFVLSLGGATTGKTLTLLSSHTLDRTITVPNVTGTLATLENAQTFSALQTFDANAVANAAINISGAGGAGVYGDGTSMLRLTDVTSGFGVEWQLASGGLTANRVLIVPDGSGNLVLAVATQSMNNKTLTVTGNLLKSTTAASGVAFSDNTTAAKQLRVVLSGASANNHSLAFANTAARTYTHGDDSSTLVGSTGSSALTGQTASVGATTLYTTTHAGLYRISIYAVLTAVTIPGNLTLTALWTDPQQAQTLTVNRGGSIAYGVVGAIEEGSVLVRATSGTTLQYSTTLTGTATYNVYAVAEVVTNS